MRTKIMSLLVSILVLLGLTANTFSGWAAPLPQSPEIQPIIQRYRARIQTLMADHAIPGLAIAVVDDQSVLWVEGFGYTDTDRKHPVDTSTLFSIQSMSKSFTATAVMLAVQDGLLDLDTPISTYLPDFRVNSIFEEHPEQKMTVRMLLAHTAGFTHEAPIGSNYDRPTHTFEEHIASISDTWLLFPVGSRYTYSNLGIDLAGYIVQVRSGMPFTEYVREKIYSPLGMQRSMFATPEIRRQSNRAVGHLDAPVRPVVPFLILPSGGVYTTADDLARYVMFHINRGAIGGQRVLQTELAETLYTPPFAPSIKAQYALGLGVEQRQGARYIGHGGGGFGFLSYMAWYPELKLGGLILTNSAAHPSVHVDVMQSLLDDIITENSPVYEPRLAAAAAALPSTVTSAGDVMADHELARLIKSHALDEPSSTVPRQDYAGMYMMTVWDLPFTPIKISDRNGSLYNGRDLLVEAQPGLFFDPHGEVYNLASPHPTYRNWPIVKYDENAVKMQTTFVRLSGMLFLSALLLWPVRAITRQVRHKPGSGMSRPFISAAWLSAGAAFFGLLLLGFLSALPQMLSVPWPAPLQDIQWWFNALLIMPYLVLAAAAGTAVLTISSWREESPGRALRIYLLIIAAVALAYAFVLLM
jgi:CubicO group peptidase (beta-lactamase class C family)